jgi:hypothetical protein
MDIKKYSERIVLGIEEETPEFLAVKIVMQEGALRFQEQVIEALNAAGELDAIKIIEQVEFDVTKGI